MLIKISEIIIKKKKSNLKLRRKIRVKTYDNGQSSSLK